MALTPYMSLDLPTPTVTLGPEWAEQLNAALEFIDAHDHTAGKGRLITSAALNINSDLSINSQNLTSARSYNFQNLGAPIANPSDLRSIYVANGELYYNDGDGNQVKITAGGSINIPGTGGIGGDYGVGDSAVIYNSIAKTYTFYQNEVSLLRGKLDTADILLRDDAIGAQAITLKSPVALAAPYDFRFPNALPIANRVLQISSTGDVDPVLITDPLLDVNAVTNTKIQDNAVTTSKISNNNVTAAKLDPSAGIVRLVKETFTSSGTWTKPAGVTHVFLRGAGGGGGGGSGSGSLAAAVSQAGGAGGAGAPIVTDMVSVTAASYTVTIGTGGAGGVQSVAFVGATGANGGNTTFVGTDVNFFAIGGAGGQGGQNTTGGTAAVNTLSGVPVGYIGGGGGNTTFGGGNGGRSIANSTQASGGLSINGSGGGGGGGGSSVGAGAIGGDDGGNTGNAGSSAAANSGAGGGGGGGAGNASGPNIGGAGGSGGSGLLEIYYWQNVNP